MKNLIFVYSIVGLLFLSSCIKEIKIKTDNIEKLPVINCIFSPDSVFKIFVSLPTEITNNELHYVEDASIKITSENNTVINLYYTGKNGIYKSTTKPEINILYTLEVDVPGFETIKATDKIPEPVNIEDVEYYYDIDILNNDSIPMSRITFTDDVNFENYYDCIDFEKLGNERIYNINYHGEFIPDNVLLAENYIDYNPTSFFFSDMLFNGSQYKISLPFADSFYTNSNIEFRTTSKNYYFFRKYWTRHLYNQSNDQNIGNDFEDIDFMELLFSGDPIEMFTNIENGYGIFAGYSCDVWFSVSSKENY